MKKLPLALLVLFLLGCGESTETPPQQASKPTAEKSTTAQPTAEKPTAEQSTTEQPTAEKPTAEQSTTGEPTAENPTAEQSTTGEPTAEKPTAEQSTTELPTAENPAAEQSTTAQLTAENPTAEQSTTEQPTTENPTAEQLTTEQLTAENPTAEKAIQPDISVAHISGTGAHTVPLSNLTPERIASHLTMNLSSVETLIKLPNMVHLNNIVITGQELSNHTPYTVTELLLRKSGEIYLVKLGAPLGKYSKGKVDTNWVGAEVVNYTTLSNSTFEYNSLNVPGGYPKIRRANANERTTGELLQIYDRYMINHPDTLGEITTHLKSICADNTDCSRYPESAENYAADTYYAKSVSGLNTRFWIDPDVWGLADMPSMNFTSSQSDQKQLNLWMSPVLMDQVYSGYFVSAVDGWQGFIHEYYHNHGFGHQSGWASDNGIDDMFGKKVLNEYLLNNRNYLILPNVIIKEVTQTAAAKYQIRLGLSDDSQALTARLLSTEKLSATIEQNATDMLTITFTEIPATDVYLSFYSENSRQMSSVALKFTIDVTTQAEVTSFNNNISYWLQEYDVVNVSSQSWAWIAAFNLPSENIKPGKVVNFSSSASFDSTIYYDGGGDLLQPGNSISYRFNGVTWDRL